MAPGDSSARLEMKYPEPEDCLVILLGPRTSPGKLEIKCSASEKIVRPVLSGSGLKRPQGGPAPSTSLSSLLDLSWGGCVLHRAHIPSW